MNLLIPVDLDHTIRPVAEAKLWLQVSVDGGKMQSVKEGETQDSFDEPSHIAVVQNDNEYVWPFIEQNMLVLVAHHQKSLDEIVEAYLFKELNELAY